MVAKKVVANDHTMKYVLIGTLIVLLGFAIAYIYNIQHQQNEKFESKYNVVYLYSETCPYCVKFTPVFDEWASQNANSISVQSSKFAKGTAEGAMYVQKYQISGFPTVIIEKPDGSLADKQIGYVDLNSFTQFVKSAMLL